MPNTADRDALSIGALRFLAVDMVEAAKSGHPGAPLGQAPLAYRLWTRHLRFDPADPAWPDRDRFVLSCGHASALLYALLHLAGYDLSIDELRRFRQLGSKTPGHPEHGHTPGVETTTGPLGQGFANAVGMAMAARSLAARFDRPGCELFGHRVWVIASDGDLMEGVASEAASLAGHHRLGNLKVCWDDNRISIDGSTELAFTEDVAARFEAYGWRTLRVDECPDATLSDNAEQTVAELRTTPGKDIALFGGGELFRSLLSAGLVDEVSVSVVPVLLGGGIPLLPPPADRARLRLRSHRVYETTGTVLLHYDIIPK